MIDLQRFECLLESLNSEIETLPDDSVRSNLETIHDALYRIFEDVSLSDTDRVAEENEVLRNLLTVYLSHEDKQYIRIKYDIDL